MRRRLKPLNLNRYKPHSARLASEFTFHLSCTSAAVYGPQDGGVALHALTGLKILWQPEGTEAEAGGER